MRGKPVLFVQAMATPLCGSSIPFTMGLNPHNWNSDEHQFHDERMNTREQVEWFVRPALQVASRTGADAAGLICFDSLYAKPDVLKGLEERNILFMCSINSSSFSTQSSILKSQLFDEGDVAAIEQSIGDVVASMKEKPRQKLFE